MRILITGAAGFVGRHLATHLRAAGHDVVGVGRETERLVDFEYKPLDLLDARRLGEVVASVRPDGIAHLAAQASVQQSWREPRQTLLNNVEATLNMLEAGADARVLVAGSGEVYGRPATLPVDESHELRPQNPYAVSKAATDLLAGFYADVHEKAVIRTRAFNHFGPGQSDEYVVGAFARQIAEAGARGERGVAVKTGDLAARRDFTDVRDVVRAYALLLEGGEPGVYNICSGRSHSASDILAALAQQSALDVTHETDPARIRRHDVMEIRGSHDKLTAATGWQPEIPFEQTIADTLDWWRSR